MDYLLLKLKKVRRKQLAYSLAAVLDLIILSVIIYQGIQSSETLVTPLVSSIKSAYYLNEIKSVEQTFSFAPGTSLNKLTKVDLEGLDYLSFFDVPINPDGTLNKVSTGYKNFKSKEAASLIERADFFKTDVLLTLSQMNNQLIRQILDDAQVQKKAIDEITEIVLDSKIDGVTLDFEYNGSVPSIYKERYTKFIKDLSVHLKSVNPEAKVAVAVPNNFKEDGLYNLEELSKNSDKIFVIAYSFIVPEAKNQNPQTPFYGYEDQYWNDVYKSLENFSSKVPAEKLVLERAWYGYGENYPLYTPNLNIAFEKSKKPTKVTMDQQTVNKLVVGVPKKSKEAARRNIPLIGKALEDEGILNSNVLAYALATIEHETAGTFEPIDEIQGRISARRRGYEGGTNYYGRGFIQLTHLRNYKAIGKRIGLDDQLVKNPELASTPEVAAKILAAFFKDNNVANLASQGKFMAARSPINPDLNGRRVANLAIKYD